MKMKKLLVLFVGAFLVGCSCLGQIPPITTYVDNNCQAYIPDLLPMIIISDNCEIVTVYQNPEAGAMIGVGITEVQVTAVDASGNETSVFTEVTALDTIAPVIQLNPDYIADL